MKTLVINTGSSSIKFALFQMPEGTELAAGLVEQIGEKMGSIKIQTQETEHAEKLEIANHQVGLKLVSDWLMDPKFNLIKDATEVEAIGHRVVHGGEAFQKLPLLMQP